MNSYVCVEEQEVVCDEYDSLVLSASSISGSSIDSEKNVEDDTFSSKEVTDLITDNTDLASKTYLVCMGDSRTRGKRKANKRKKIAESLELYGSTKPNSDFENFSTKLMPIDISGNYDDCDQLEFDYLPFETVLMNYPEEVDYFDLNEKILNSSVTEDELDLFESDSDCCSFDGFSDHSSSSFEGFLEKSNKNKSRRSGLNVDLESNNSSEVNLNFSLKTKSNKDSLTTKNSSCKSENSLNCFDKLTPERVSLKIESSTPLSETSQSHQNYSKSIISPVYSSSNKKFKEKVNVSGGEQQKSKEKTELKINSKKYTVDQCYHENIESSFERTDYAIEMESYRSMDYSQFSAKDEALHKMQEKNTIEELNFSDECSVESFEGFEDINNDNSNLYKEQVQGIKIKKENLDVNDFIGNYCNEVGCTVSWLESRSPMSVPQKVKHGIVFELSEFAKKIAWEIHYVADWICRLRGFINVTIENEDINKINSILKRRRALTVNFAGYCNLKSKLRIFDSEIFSLPSIEKLEKIGIDNVNSNKNEIKKEENSKILKDNIKSKINKEKIFNKSFIEDDILRGNEENIDNINNDSNSNNFNINTNDGERSEEQESLSLKLISSDNDISDILSTTDSDVSSIDEIQISSLNVNNEVIVGNTMFENNIISSKGRIRKPTAKAQELFSKQNNSSLSLSNSLNSNSEDFKLSTDSDKSKMLHPIFVNDGKVIGPHCVKNGIDIQFLNSAATAKSPITNGVVYELYHFFRERKASLTSLVHTLYRLKNKPIDKSQIIATMAKIHELVKVMWNELLDKNAGMPFEEFNFNCEKNNGNVDSEPFKNSKDETPYKEPAHKKIKLHKENISVKELTSDKEEPNLNTLPLEGESSGSNLNHQSESNLPNESLPMSKSFDLNSTKGDVGKITRGDIVYLYTKWLKKKMEGHSDVFVTDLSKEVEELINERKVECLRIPVGTLMSSSVKLFEEFRKLSKVSMADAKTYLLGNWITDIKLILNTNYKKKGLPEITNDNSQENQSILNHNTENMNIKEPLIKNVPEGYKVEKIVGYRIVKIGDESVTEYRIRWLGYSSKEDSWINEADLNCPKILAKFWEALNKQRALKNLKVGGKQSSYKPTNERELNKVSIPYKKGNEMKDDEAVFPSQMKMSTSDAIEVMNSASITSQGYEAGFNSVSRQRKKTSANEKGQENISPFFGRDNVTSRKFFDLMIENLKLNLVDYCYKEEDEPFVKRFKITKGEILEIYDDWRHQNQEHLLTGGNQKLNVNILISKIKDLAESKKVRNFNHNSILDVCYRISLMKEKLKDPEKINEYLNGDFMEMMQISQKHQETLRRENSIKLKRMKENNVASVDSLKISSKINEICNLQNESLIIAQCLNSNIVNKSKYLETEISNMKEVWKVQHDQADVIENIKKENIQVVKELEQCGVKEETLNDLLHITLKMFI